MNKTNMLILVLVILSTTTLTGSGLATGKDANISTNETIVGQATAAVDTISINEDVNVINITKNSNETTIEETIMKEEQEMSSPGFSLTDTVISLITGIVLITIFKIGRYIK